MYVSGHIVWKIYWFLALTLYAPRSKGDKSIFFSKLSLNIVVNFMEWKLTDSGEIIEIWILTRCLKLVQISWLLASLLQNHLRKSVGHCVRLSANLRMQNLWPFFFRHIDQPDALIQFAHILVDVSSICKWSTPVNRIEIKQEVWTDIR